MYSRVIESKTASDWPRVHLNPGFYLSITPRFITHPDNPAPISYNSGASIPIKTIPLELPKVSTLNNSILGRILPRFRFGVLDRKTGMNRVNMLNAEHAKLTKFGKVTITEGRAYVEGFEGYNMSCREMAVLATV